MQLAKKVILVANKQKNDYFNIFENKEWFLSIFDNNEKIHEEKIKFGSFLISIKEENINKTFADIEQKLFDESNDWNNKNWGKNPLENDAILQNFLNLYTSFKNNSELEGENCSITLEIIDGNVSIEELKYLDEFKIRYLIKSDDGQINLATKIYSFKNFRPLPKKEYAAKVGFEYVTNDGIRIKDNRVLGTVLNQLQQKENYITR